MITLDDISLHLAGPAGDVDILDGIDLRVDGSLSLSIVGPSGSGKTSLLAIIGGIERPTRGTAHVFGHRLERMSEDELAVFRRDYLGILFQSFHLIPTLSALENVALPLRLARRRGVGQRAMEMLDQVGLTERARHYPAQLSGGEQQRVALARALVAEPRLLLADEPTGNLDRDTGASIIELLFACRARFDALLVLVTHDHELAARCDQRFAMHAGSLLPLDERAPGKRRSLVGA